MFVCSVFKWKHVKITDLLHSPSSSDRLISFKIRMTSVIMLNAISYDAISISVCWCCFCVPKDCFAPRTKTALSVIWGYVCLFWRLKHVIFIDRDEEALVSIWYLWKCACHSVVMLVFWHHVDISWDCFAPVPKLHWVWIWVMFVYSVCNRKHEKAQSACIILAAGDRLISWKLCMPFSYVVVSIWVFWCHVGILGVVCSSHQTCEFGLCVVVMWMETCEIDELTSPYSWQKVK